MSNIILVGYMGCGKTTVGKNLAKIAKYVFTDTDEMIEKIYGKTIKDIFAESGEEVFRQMETEVLKKLISDKSKNLVISTGGGMPIKFENRKLLEKLGTVVYLKASPETIYEHVKHDTKRPLLQCENPQQKIREMLAQRNPVYESVADIIINVDNLKQSEIADRLKRSCHVNKRI